MDIELTKIRDEVHRKLGRNVTLFQKIEALLKALVIDSHFSGYASDFERVREKTTKAVNKRTMGQLATPFLKNLTTKPEELSVLDESKGVYISFGFTIQGEKFYFEQKKSLTLIVSERNELIHHFWQKWNLDSIQGLNLAEQYLDQQHSRIQLEFQNLRILAEMIEEGRKDIADFIASDTGRRALKQQFLRQSTLMSLLCDIAAKEARSDGWTVLSIAVSIINKQVPEEISSLKERYGCKNLKSFMLMTELFDLHEEPTAKGGRRMLYRIKSAAIAPL